MARSTMNELTRVAGTYQSVSGKTVVIEAQDASSKIVALRIDMGNGIKLRLGNYSKLEAINVLKALTMYVDALKPQLPVAFMLPGAAQAASLFVTPGK